MVSAHQNTSSYANKLLSTFAVLRVKYIIIGKVGIIPKRGLKNGEQRKLRGEEGEADETRGESVERGG